jgi:hypothetical protein
MKRVTYERANNVATRDVAKRSSFPHHLDNKVLKCELNGSRCVHLELNELKAPNEASEVDGRLCHLVRSLKYFLSTLRLRLITTQLPDSIDTDCVPSSIPLVRPADRLEPWPLNASPSIDAFADACIEERLPVALAARLVVERALVVEAITAATDRSVVELSEMLDRSGEEAAVTLPLSPALAAYLRLLRRRDRRDVGRPALLPLPVRLRDRLRDREPTALLDPKVINSALSWERAAASCGMTMMEWSATVALRSVG